MYAKALAVASYVGAWIETLVLYPITDTDIVASYVGAWIETVPLGNAKGTGGSHPMWVRGLKLQTAVDKTSEADVASYVGAWIETHQVQGYGKTSIVASYVGAWIETSTFGLYPIPLICRILCGCVD